MMSGLDGRVSRSNDHIRYLGPITEWTLDDSMTARTYYRLISRELIGGLTGMSTRVGGAYGSVLDLRPSSYRHLLAFIARDLVSNPILCIPLTA